MGKFLKSVMGFALISVFLISTVAFFSAPVFAEPGINSQATVGYRSNTGTATTSSPKVRTWDGSTWSGESELATTASPIRTVRVAYSSYSGRYGEKIVATLSDSGNLYAYVWDPVGSSWTATKLNTGGLVYSAAPTDARRPFDIAYEKSSGHALAVYDIVPSPSDVAKDFAYRIWNGATWSAEAYVDVSGHAAAQIAFTYFVLAAKPVGDTAEIGVIGLDSTNGDINAWIWNGGAMTNFKEITATGNGEPAVAYESLTGYAWFVAGEATALRFWRWTGAWDAASTTQAVGGTVAFVTAKSDPTSDKLMATTVDAAQDLNTFYNAGAGSWATAVEHDASTEPSATRGADFDWEPTGSKGLLVWGRWASKPANYYRVYKTFTAPSWGSEVATSTPSINHPWVQLRRNPRPVSTDATKILGVWQDGTTANYPLGSLRWDGTTLTATGSAFTATTGAFSAAECFEIDFQNYMPATVSVDPASKTVGSAGPITLLPIFTVDIKITDADSLYGWEIQLLYETKWLTAINAVEGTFLSTGAGPSGTWFRIIDMNDQYSETQGRIWLTATRLGDVDGASGTGQLAKIYFVPDNGPTSPNTALTLQNIKLLGYWKSYKKTYAIPSTKTDGTVTINFTYRPTLSVSPAAQNQFINTNFQVDITIKDAYNVYAWELTLAFDKTRIFGRWPPGATEGTFLSSVGTTTFYWRVDNDTGIVYANCTLQGDVQPKNVTYLQTGTLVTINLRTQATTGLTNLDLKFSRLTIYTYTHFKRTYYIRALADQITENDGTVTVQPGVPEFPLGLIPEIAIPIVIVYVWWRRRKIKAPKSN